MPDSPVHAWFLTPEERIAALERVRDDQVGTENHKLKRSRMREAVTDVRTWLVVLLTLVSECQKAILLWQDNFLTLLPLAAIPNGGLSNCEYRCSYLHPMLRRLSFSVSNLIIKNFGYT